MRGHLWQDVEPGIPGESHRLILNTQRHIPPLRNQSHERNHLGNQKIALSNEHRSLPHCAAGRNNHRN